MICLFLFLFLFSKARNYFKSSATCPRGWNSKEHLWGPGLCWEEADQVEWRLEWPGRAWVPLTFWHSVWQWGWTSDRRAASWVWESRTPLLDLTRGPHVQRLAWRTDCQLLPNSILPLFLLIFTWPLMSKWLDHVCMRGKETSLLIRPLLFCF